MKIASNHFPSAILRSLALNLTLLFSITYSLAQSPLLIPEQLEGDQFNLTIQHGIHQFYSDFETNTMGINGALLGPTLTMTRGEDVSIELTNQLGEPTTIHWHGMHVSAENDGGPHTVIEDGTTWNPSFEVLDHAGTYWYHPHLHENTNRQVLKGIAGFVIVQDEVESALDLPRTYGLDDIPVVFQTKAFDSDGQIVVETEMDTSVMANGVVDAFVDLPAQIVRFRCLNGASQRSFNLTRSDGGTFHMIGTDGGLLGTPLEMTELLLSPGERAEILIDLNGMEGQGFDLMNMGSLITNNIHGSESVTMGPSSIIGYNDNPLNGADFDLLHINVGTQTTNPVLAIPTTLIAQQPILESDADITRNFTLSPEVMGPTGMVNGPFVMNGASFDMDVINVTIPLDNVEIWSIFNQTGVAHPFHTHDVQFYILDRNGESPPAHEQGRKDVVLIKSMETVRYITQFSDFADADTPYMYHCHMLPHEDSGMMGQFVVVDDNTSVNMQDVENGPTLFPNPVNGDRVQICWAEQPHWGIKVLSMDGKLVYENLAMSSSCSMIDVSELKGLYLLQLTGRSQMETLKLMVD